MNHAVAWNPHLTGDAYAPNTLLVVDKKNQIFFVFSGKNPMHKEYSWQCTTGQAHGDKLVEGDLKTPEGIYFLERRLTKNLPYDLYGELAFTLNYPNPVDRINNKTGHSIWIHGRGKEVVPYDTEGCVAMDMERMLKLEKLVTLRNTPVIITENVTWETNGQDSEQSHKIIEQSIQWAMDWQIRSDRYFEHYDPAMYPKSTGQCFECFKADRKKLFNQYSWMDVYIEQPKVLEGPNYFVSYFNQVFYAPGFYSVGVKRLYWKTDESGDFKIVGKEWRSLPDDLLEQRYLAARTKELHEVIFKWVEARLAADIQKYASFYYKDAIQDDLRGINSIVDRKKQDVWGKGSLPTEIELKNITVSRVDQGFEVKFVQNYSNASGYSDCRFKTLVLAPFGSDWLIKAERTETR